MGTMFVQRRNGTKVLRPRYMLAAPSPLTVQDRRNIDALVAMYDHAAMMPDRSVPVWSRRMMTACVEDVLRSLSAGGVGVRAETFETDLEWVEQDIGVPGIRLRDICAEFGWDYDQVRAGLLAVARRAQAGHRRRVPTLGRPRRLMRELAVA